MHAIDSVIFRGFFSTGEMHAVFTDRALVQHWLDIEAALARVQAGLGIVPAEAAEEIARQAHVENIDFEALRETMELVGYPIVGLVKQLSTRCAGTAGGYVHWGATTHDIMDTATVLQLREALALITRDLARLNAVLATLAEHHRDTVMAGRTHGQHALPITLGYKFAIWLEELGRHEDRFEQCRPRLLRCQFAGAAGTLASLGSAGSAVHAALAEALGLLPSPTAWHTARDGFGEFVSLCGMLTATLAKIAREVAVLQQNEFAELEEPFETGKGASSTMPQKRNPILCEAIIGIAHVARQQVPAMLAAMQPEHERAMGEWHTEWDILPHICQLSHAALTQSLRVCDGLRVYPDQMRRNLDLTNGLITAESVMMHLGQFTGRQRAHDIVYDACAEAMTQSRPLLDVLADTPAVHEHISREQLQQLLDPANYLGVAGDWVDQVLMARKTKHRPAS